MAEVPPEFRNRQLSQAMTERIFALLLFVGGLKLTFDVGVWALQQVLGK
jgi:uncharacterized membrane protein YiaA